MFILIVIVILIIFCVCTSKKVKSKKSNFGSIQQIKDNHQTNNCFYMNRQYPVGNVPGSNILLTNAEKVELDRKF